VFEIVESLWIKVESSAAPGENHRMVVTVSDVVIIVSSTTVFRLLTIADTMAQSAGVRQSLTTRHVSASGIPRMGLGVRTPSIGI